MLRGWGVVDLFDEHKHDAVGETQRATLDGG
jgi:hypothetical protein